MPRPALRALAGLVLSLGTACGSANDPADDEGAGLTDPGATGGPDVPTGDADDTGESDGSGESGGSGDDAGSPVWDDPYCFPVAGAMKWPEPLPSHEVQVVALVNAARAAGGDCGANGSFAPSAPLTMHASLHCAARVHSKDMADRMYFDHTNPDGEDPFDRMARAGYGAFMKQAENIAMGTLTPEDTVAGWLASDGHCANILDPTYTEIGVGVYENGPMYWTQTFAAPN